MTAEKFGELAADLWRARQRREAMKKKLDKSQQRWEAARKELTKSGLVIKQCGKLRANPAVAEYMASGKEVLRLTRMLAA